MLKDHQPKFTGSWLAGVIPTERSLGRQEVCLYCRVNCQHDHTRYKHMDGNLGVGVRAAG